VIAKFPSLPTALAAIIAAFPAPALAQRHVWLVPGTAGAPPEGVRWDRASGCIIAASGAAILRIDPVTGAREVLHRLRPEGDAPEAPAPCVQELVLGPGGSIDFSRSGPAPDRLDGRIYRLTPDGQVRVIAGRGDEGPFQGEAEDALEARFQPTDLAAGAHGERFVADAASGRVVLLQPLAGGGFRAWTLNGRGAGDEGAPGPSYDPDTDDLDETGEGPLELAYLTDPEAWAPADRLIVPTALAAAPDGTVYLADWSDQEDGRPPWVFRLSPPAAGGGQIGQLQRLPVPGTPVCQCPPGQGRLPVRKPHRLEVGDDGTVYILGHGLLWAFTPLPAAQGGAAEPWWRSKAVPEPQWHCEAIAGPLAAKGIVADWPPQGAPADQLDPTVLRRIRHMAAAPGGGLLLSDGVDGIRFLGPAGDADLAERIRGHARARLAGEADRARTLLAGLERTRDAPFGLRMGAVCKGATVAPNMDADVLGEIESFLVDPRMLAFRAAMAAQAIRAGGDPGPDPRQRLLAQRHVWQVPNTHGSAFQAMAWDAGDGTLVAARKNQILRLDPALGASRFCYAAPQVGDRPTTAGGPLPPLGHPIHALAVGPGGTVHFTTAPDQDGSEPDPHVWSLSTQGEPQLLAGSVPGARVPGPDPEQAFTPSGLAAGPGGELYLADGEAGVLLLLTPGEAGARAGVRRLAERLEGITGAIALGQDGELLLGGDRHLQRLLPVSGGGWRLERLPRPGTAGCAAAYDPVRGLQEFMMRVLAVVPGRDGGFCAADEGQLWAFAPEPALPGAPPRWRSQLVSVSGQHALPLGAWFTDQASTLPVPPGFWPSVAHMTGIPGGGLAVSGGRDQGIRFIGPPGDGHLFRQVQAFRAAEADRDWPRARRILGVLLWQRRLAGPEACDLPFSALARAPRLGPLPRTLRRLVGSFLVRPQLHQAVAFRAWLAAEAILAQSEWARHWVAEGCPGDAVPAAGAEPPVLPFGSFIKG